MLCGLTWRGYPLPPSSLPRERLHCFGTAAKVQEKMDRFFAGLAQRTTEVKQRCRTVLQAQADALVAKANQLLGQAYHVDLTLVSV